MKKFNVLFLFLIVAAFAISISSCGKDVCYECTGFDDGTTSLEDLGTICEGMDDGAGATLTTDEINATVTTYEAFGGTCVKQ